MKQFFKQMMASALGMIIGLWLAFLIVPLIIVVFFKAMQGAVEPIQEKSVLRLDLHGRLVEKARPLDFDPFSLSPFSMSERGTGLYEVTKALEMAKKDKRIQGLLLKLDGLDAGWASIEALRRAILDFGQSGKFVYAYAETMDEATYFLATAAERIFLQPNGGLEMNGLAMEQAFMKGLLQKLEVQPRIFRVGKFKAAIEPLTLDKMSEDNRQQNQMLLTDIWAIVREGIRKPGRLEPDAIDKMASGLDIVTAQDAFDKGFVQQLAYDDEVAALLSEKTVGPDEPPRYVSAGQLLREPRAMKRVKEKIAVFFVEGEIVGGYGGRGLAGSRAFVEDLEDARSDENVKAIVVRVNSPGGDALASDVIWRELSVTDQEIPVVASMSDVAASGGYYVAAGARHIVAEAGTLTGSIGVFGVLLDAEDFFRNKLGVSFDRVVSHPYADIGSFNREMTEFEREKIQSSVESVYGRFVSVVRDSRKLGNDIEASAFAEGRVWSGLRAKEMRLVDEIGGLDTALKRAALIAGLEHYEVDFYPREEEPLKRLAELLAGETVRAVLAGTPFERAWQSLVAVPLKSGTYARIPFDVRIR